MINGECSIQHFPLHTKVIRRKNKGLDFGAFSHCICRHLKKEYDYYVFLNSSVRGPFPKDVDWVSRFLSLFNNPDVKLVGTSINMLDEGNLSHVQTMFFILEKEAFFYLKDEKNFFDEKDPIYQTTDIQQIIWYKEIVMSKRILEKGWNINCILANYRDKDYRKEKKNLNPSASDPYYSNAYWGKTIRPEDVIFFKINRIPFNT